MLRCHGEFLAGLWVYWCVSGTCRFRTLTQNTWSHVTRVWHISAFPEIPFRPLRSIRRWCQTFLMGCQSLRFPHNPRFFSLRLWFSDPYPHARTMILAAIGELHKSSCVRFVQRSTEQYFIKFTRGHGWASESHPDFESTVTAHNDEFKAALIARMACSSNVTTEPRNSALGIDTYW